MTNRRKKAHPRAASKPSESEVGDERRDEPEQMQLWRRLIAYREALVEGIAAWRRFGAKQREGWANVAADGDQPVGMDVHRLHAEQVVADYIADGLRQLTHLDRVIEGKSRTSRGFSIEQLRELANLDRDPDRERAERFTLLYLEAKRDKLDIGTTRRIAEEVTPLRVADVVVLGAGSWRHLAPRGQARRRGGQRRAG